MTDAIRSALLDIHERVLDEPEIVAFFGVPVLIRELTAAQRLRAGAAARADNPDEPDAALYDAMRIQMAVVDPDTGTPYADGRTGDDGKPLIDPRTRATVFRADDLPALMSGRWAPQALLLDAIDALSALRPVHLQRSYPAPDRPERDTGTSAEGSGHRA